MCADLMNYALQAPLENKKSPVRQWAGEKDEDMKLTNQEVDTEFEE